jgi:N-carbamoyl-L-amino-acid hydrolase
VTRLAYSPEDQVGRALVAGWMQDAGLTVHEDAATNLIGTRSGRSGRILMTGSHLDSVKEAGHLDGAYGVVAAIEVADALQRGDIELAHTFVVVGFSNEEGAWGTPGMTGSHALVGRLKPEWLQARDLEGITLAERIAATGGQPDGVGPASIDMSDVAGFIELHIEQGPILQGSGIDIGVVRAITGRDGIELEISGVANHAGTTPMDDRHDAAVAAAHVVLAVKSLADEDRVRVATVGILQIGPGSSNVIPSRATLNIEMRDADDRRVAGALEELLVRIADITAATNTTYTYQWVPHVRAVAIDPVLASCVQEAARSLDLSFEDIDSGAGHDAQVLAAAAPVAMIFVPSAEGVSHSAREYTSPEHLVAGAEVLTAALVEADARLTIPQQREEPDVTG